MSARRFHVTGNVQGVFFRAETQRRAMELNLTGWARNALDGSVEIHAEGESAALDSLEMWCHRGPPAANVKKVTSENRVEEGLTDFRIS